jgi:uncharacterized circularly permuted ATP-grasp superfamily protein
MSTKNDFDNDPLPPDPKHRETVNALIRTNANLISNANTMDNKRSETTNWWINELASLGIKKSSSSNEGNNNRGESLSSQQLEDLTDDLKQNFIRDYIRSM